MGAIIEPRYPWQRHYEAAILSADPTQLPSLIATARAAIDARMREIGPVGALSRAEALAIADARVGLRRLSQQIVQTIPKKRP